MNATGRAAELPASPEVLRGFISLSAQDSVDAWEDVIILDRGYATSDNTDEDAYDTYTVYRGGPGFGVFEKALNDQLTMEQAARWWDEYRDDFAVLTYRALFAVEEHTDSSVEPLTRKRLGDLLSWDAGVDPIRQAAAIEYAIRDALLQERDGGLMLTAAGEDTLHAADRPDRLGEDNRRIFGPPMPEAATSTAAIAASSFRAPAGAVASADPAAAGASGDRPGDLVSQPVAGWNRGR